MNDNKSITVALFLTAQLIGAAIWINSQFNSLNLKITKMCVMLESSIEDTDRLRSKLKTHDEKYKHIYNSINDIRIELEILKKSSND